MNYEELVKALRCVELRLSCNECEYGTWSESGEAWGCEFERRDADAAAAIEELQAGVKRLNMRCADCEYASKPWPELEPKRGEFEKSLHEMFDSIWDCDINHPIFQDTVGELMEAVLQAYDTVNRAKMEVQE